MTVTDPLRIPESAHNHVVVRGRVSAAPETKILPSGDELSTVRVVVPRDRAARRRSRQSVDTIDCAAWTAGLRRKVARLEPDDQVEIVGQLRRRFSRGPAGPRSWVSVEILRVRRLDRGQ